MIERGQFDERNIRYGQFARAIKDAYAAPGADRFAEVVSVRNGLLADEIVTADQLTKWFENASAAIVTQITAKYHSPYLAVTARILNWVMRAEAREQTAFFRFVTELEEVLL